MSLVDYFMFFLAVFLLVLGLIFVAAGFGIFVAGRLEGFVVIIIGTAMFWEGWIISGAHGIQCATAAVLNMFDAASTVAFWNFEINPFALTMGPTLFMISKIVTSIVIILYAKLHRNPKSGGIILSVVLALIVGWNLSQHLVAYLDLKSFSYTIVLGTMIGFLATILCFMFFVNLWGEDGRLKAQKTLTRKNADHKLLCCRKDLQAFFGRILLF